MTTKLQLSMGCIKYDRTRAIFDGNLQPEGIDLITKEIVDRDSSWLTPIRYKVFDVAEMPLTNYVIGLDEGHTDFIALPIFLSRSFRHSTIYINKSAGIRTPKDLEGKKVGIGNYFGSTTLWVRGLLQDQYDVQLNKVKWVTKNKVPLDKVPSSVQLDMIDRNVDMDVLLENGEIDALIYERAPRAYGHNEQIVRLFENFKDEEIKYYEESRIFPIRHVLVIKKDLYIKNPWVAQSLYKLFELAKREASLDKMFDGHSKFMLPFMQNAIEETRKVFGEDYWPYGLEKNGSTLSAFTKLCYEQGYTRKHYNAEELFATHVISV